MTARRSGDPGDSRTIKDFPEYYHYKSEKEFTYNDIKQGNRNPLLYKNIGADGIEDRPHRGGGLQPRRLGACAATAASSWCSAALPSDERARDQESERLIEWAFREFGDYTPVRRRRQGRGGAEVWLGARAKVPLTAAKDVDVTLPRKSRSRT